jgi:hypothetical protein
MLTSEAKQQIVTFVASLPAGLRHPPATEEQLASFEREHGAIPDDYRWFLSECGGGIAGSEHLDDIHRLFRTHRVFRDQSRQSGWKMKGVFVIGWDGSGNPFGIEEATGRILVEDHNFGGIHELASSLGHFILKGAGS